MDILGNESFFLLNLVDRSLLSSNDKFFLNQLAIVISPHHDDESIGMGGTIAKLVDFGFTVYIIYVTAEKLDLTFKRKTEAITAVASLGIKNTENIISLDFEDGNLKEFSLNYSRSAEILRSKINEIEFRNNIIDINGKKTVKEHTLILTTSRFDAHRDHEETFNLIKNSTRKRIILEFPIVNHMASYYTPNCIIDISDYFSLKINALKKYTGEIQKKRILWNDIFELDRLTGQKQNFEFAESCYVSWFGHLNK